MWDNVSVFYCFDIVWVIRTGSKLVFIALILSSINWLSNYSPFLNKCLKHIFILLNLPFLRSDILWPKGKYIACELENRAIFLVYIWKRWSRTNLEFHGICHKISFVLISRTEFNEGKWTSYWGELSLHKQFFWYTFNVSRSVLFEYSQDCHNVLFFFFQTLTFIDTAYKVCLKTRTTNQSNRPTIKQSPNKQTNKKNHTYFMYVYKTSSSYFTQPSTMSSTSRQGPLTKMATFSSACLGSWAGENLSRGDPELKEYPSAFSKQSFK